MSLLKMLALLQTRIYFNNIFGCVSIVEFVLYVLLFDTQDHPSCESIIDTVIMQAVT